MPPLVQTPKSPLHRLNFVTFAREQMNFPKNMLARYEKKKKKKKKENTIHLSREAYVKRFDMRRSNTLSFISHISMLPVGTNLQRIIEANNVRTRRSNKFYAHSWRLKIRNRPKHFSSHSLRCLVFQLTRRIMLESMTPSLSGSWLSSIRVFPL